MYLNQLRRPSVYLSFGVFFWGMISIRIGKYVFTFNYWLFYAPEIK